MIRRLARVVVAGSVSALIVACAGEPAAESSPGAEAATPGAASAVEAERIQDLIATDPARAPLAEVDAAIDQDLPVRAAELLRTRALPAAREAVTQASALEARTEEGARLRRALVAAFESRVRALEQKEGALARGMVEDVALADAFRAERQAEEQLVQVAESARSAGGRTEPND